MTQQHLPNPADLISRSRATAPSSPSVAQCLASRLLFQFVLATALTLAGCSVPPPAPADGSGSTPSSATQGLLPLPSFTSCGSYAHPVLPAKWEAVALMQDFFLDSFLVSKFVYDESAQAFRFWLIDQHGLDMDFLVTADRKLYLLAGGDQPTACTYLTAESPYTMPARDWLDPKATCIGQAPILKQDQLWWKSPSGTVGANWFWYNTRSRLPFRSMYYADAKPTMPVPIYEHFTFNYFPTFREVPATNLGKIVAMCKASNAEPTATAEYSRPSIEPLIKNSGYPNTDSRLIAQIEAWMPGVTACSSKNSLPPSWPSQVQGTVFMTAVSFKPNPFPTRVFYDWTQKAQNTTLYSYPSTKAHFSQTALLLGDTGYGIDNGFATTCHQVLPGPQVPNWKVVDRCECRAQIAPNTVLNPTSVPTKILWCPTDLSHKQVFWTWYSDAGTPVVFMQSNSSPTDGTGLNLADYYQWQPGSVAPPGTFDLPTACKNAPKKAVPQACHNCHLPVNTKTP